MRMKCPDDCPILSQDKDNVICTVCFYERNQEFHTPTADNYVIIKEEFYLGVEKDNRRC